MVATGSFDQFVTAPLFVDSFVASWESAIKSFIAELPGIVGALVILLVGVFLGRRIGSIAHELVGRAGLDEWFADSPIAPLLGEDGSFAGAVGLVVKYYVVLFALLVAIRFVGFAILEQWVQTLVVYLPRALAGAALIMFGVVFAEYAGRQAAGSEAVQQSEYGPWVTAGVKAIVYFVVAVIGLDMLGMNLEIVYLVVDGVASAIGLGITAAIALAVGVAVGFAAKEYAEGGLGEDSGSAEE